MRQALAATLALLVLLPAACADEEPDLTQRRSFSRERFPSVGMSLELARPVTIVRRKRPGVFRASRGTTYVAAFAYRRRGQQLPRGRAELSAARDRLVRAVEARGRGFRLLRSRLARVAGAPAVELLGDQTISRAPLRIRSVHVYKGDGEFVLELAASRNQFARTNRRSFERMVRSLELTGRIRR